MQNPRPPFSAALSANKDSWHTGEAKSRYMMEIIHSFQELQGPSFVGIAIEKLMELLASVG
jgi:hypothetical protein